MDLEDLFANKNKQQKYQYKREYGYQKQPQFNWLSIYEKIKQNKKRRTDKCRCQRISSKIKREI